MTTSQNGTNGEKKPPMKTPSDEEMFYGTGQTRLITEKREEGSVQERKQVTELAPKTETSPTVEQQAQNPPTTAPKATNGALATNEESAARPALPTKTRLEDIMDMVGEGKTIWDALVTVFGLNEPNYKYLILERTRLTKEEANLVSDALFVAEHGIGTDPFDFPIPEFADWVISRLHAFISVDMGKGNARDEFREITSTWMAVIKAKVNSAGLGIGNDQVGSDVDKGTNIR